MDNNVYKTPESELSTAKPDEIPEKVLKRIRSAARIAVLMTILYTLVIVLVFFTAQTNINPDSNKAAQLYLFSLVLGHLLLTIGLWKKNLICAILLLVLYLFMTIASVLTFQPIGLILLLGICYYLFMATYSCFEYRKFMAKQSKTK